MKKDRQYSVKKLFMAIFITTIILLVILLFAYGSFSIRSYANKLLEYNSVSLSEYINRLDEELDSLQETNRELVYSDSYFSMLSLDMTSDSKKVVSQYALKQILPLYIPDYGITFYSNSKEDYLYYYTGSCYSSPYDFQKRAALIHTIADGIASGEFPDCNVWFLTADDSETYLTLINGQKRTWLGTMVGLSGYLECNSLSTYSDAGSVIICTDDTYVSAAEDDSTLFSLSELTRNAGQTRYLFSKNQFLQTQEVRDLGVYITVATPFSAVVSYVLPQLLFLASVILFVLGIMLLAYKILSKIIVFPLQEIAEFSQDLEQSGEISSSMQKDFRFREFADIRKGMKELLDKQSLLEIEKNNKEKAREQAVLQYYQLQTRSHFFLNCLKSLYGMSENNQVKKMQSMIIAFSNHLRYIFHDNLNKVPLEAELREVQDYHRIILMDYTRIFILNQDVPQDMQQLEVPPLIVQTFLENTYKYNTKSGEPLVFDIKASKIELEDGIYCQLHLSDNGNGYTPEVLEKINAPVTDGYDQYNVGINNLRRRLAILYNNRCRTMFYNKPEGGACSVIYIPMEGENDK